MRLLIIELTISYIFIFSTYFAESNEEIFTPQQKNQLIEFRSMVQPLIEENFMNTDAYLFRWLKTKNFDINKAKNAFEKNVNWRRLNNIKNILNEDITKIDKEMPIRITGFGKNKSPILEFHLGQWQIRKLALSGRKNDLVRQYDRYLEKCSKIVDEIQKTYLNVTGWILLVDLKGYNAKDHGCLTCIPVFLEETQHFAYYFPDYSRLAVLYRTPRIFESILKVISPYFPEDFRKGLKVLGYNKEEFIKELEKIVPLSQVTSNFEGTFDIDTKKS